MIYLCVVHMIVSGVLLGMQLALGRYDWAALNALTLAYFSYNAWLRSIP